MGVEQGTGSRVAILGIDVGGTFTDFVLLDDSGHLSIHKLLTSASDQSQAVMQGLTEMGVGPDAKLVHGATVATNALLERQGAKTALITSQGFSDVLEIGRQVRSELYSLHPTRPAPLVPARWRYGLPERVDRNGAVVTELDLDATSAAVRDILEADIQSVAVCFLFSFANPEHEQRVFQRIAEVGGESAPFVSLSSEVLPEYREYERMSTTVINAYVAPLMSKYLTSLERNLQGRHLRVMQSNGGIMSAEAARRLAARTALSGPAGGVVGSYEVARRAGFDQVITFDMGGTSTDVALCPGGVRETTEGSIAGLPMRLPMIDIHTVGAGGGSIARRDPGGALRVGPESAGADPGPVCYGDPGAHEVTVTDSHLVLGRLDPDRFLGGRMKLDVARSRAAVEVLGDRLGLSWEAAAWGIIRIANSNMERAIRTISVERGHDPRMFTLVAFGGAGPLHACELAASLHIPRALIPPHPGVLSALGMVLADVVKDYSLTVMIPAQEANHSRLWELFSPLYERAMAELRAEGLDDDQISLFPALDMRYVGQSYELAVPLELGVRHMHEQDPAKSPPSGSQVLVSAASIASAYHAAHLQRFSYASESEPVEVVNVRLKAVGRTPKPNFGQRRLSSADPRAARVGYRQVYFAGYDNPHASHALMAALYDRELLVPGNMVVGPAVVHQLDTTTVIPPGWSATMDTWGNLIASSEPDHQTGDGRSALPPEASLPGPS